ncbi:hypothetical protein [Janthinobacterium sp. 17J80-10]|uniref:hypothetical protein n=1 Tax=Janthinobacterium sp. 17J80-10 TaxID=2497863 RepID=UPI001005705A|nr:hypothetical protein [Janthinobacterium sp. 17J80-10]QAU33151.1 hypothetical protein EKL02_02570 [Janthinobacterium sp. 17J80-10]
MPSVKHETWALLSLGLLFPVFAYAADNPPLPVASAYTTAVSLGEFTAEPALEPQAMPSATLTGMGPSIAADTLEQYRGGTAITSEAVSHGLLQDATATNVATGNNSIAGGAFANTFGLPIVIQNSGANVLIQNSTIVNVQFR